MQKVAIIYVDFDNTLYCHDKVLTSRFPIDLDKLTQKYLDKDLINKLYKIKENNAKRNIKTYIALLSTSATDRLFREQIDLINQNYENLLDLYFHADNQNYKITKMLEFNNRASDNIINTLLIDDSTYVIDMVRNAGYDAVTPEYFTKQYKIMY